jgi:hypothetical protein
MAVLLLLLLLLLTTRLPQAATSDVTADSCNSLTAACSICL